MHKYGFASVMIWVLVLKSRIQSIAVQFQTMQFKFANMKVHTKFANSKH